MTNRKNQILKRDFTYTETVYFEVLDKEPTALKLKEVCKLRNGVLSVTNSAIPNYVYNSDINSMYSEISGEERNTLRELYLKTITANA